MSAHVRRNRFAWLWCWHRRGDRRIMMMNNGAIVYCPHCLLRRVTVWDDDL